MRKLFLVMVLTVVTTFTACGNPDASKTAVIDTEEALKEGADAASGKISANVSEQAVGMKVEQGTNTIQETNVIQGTTVTQGGPYGEISLTIPEGWEYELCPVDGDVYQTGMYGIHFYPEGEREFNGNENFIEVDYTDNFGVCGTGLEEQTVTLAGDTAEVGYYDGSPVWDFVAFEGKNKGIVAGTYAVDDSENGWWKEKKDQVMDILDSMTFDPDITEGAVGIYESDSEIEAFGVYVSAKKISPTSATLSFQYFETDAKQELSFGEDFVLEKKDGTEWKEVKVVEGEYGYNDIAHIISTEEPTEYHYDWEWLYGKLQPGEYRIAVNIQKEKEGGGYDSDTSYAHFLLR